MPTFIRSRVSLLAVPVVGLSAVLALTPAPRALAAGSGRPASSGWTMYNYDREGSRYNSAEHQLGPRNVGRLRVLWRVPTAGSVFGTPTVSDGVVYAGDYSGAVHAVRTDGTPLWTTQVDGPVTDSILIMRNTLIFGDLNGNIYGLDPRTGAIRWKIRPNPHPFAAIFGSATPVGQDFAIGTTIDIEEPGRGPADGVDGRGSVVLADPADGHVIWQTYTITDAQLRQGATGADVWSTPTFDQQTDTVYVTTGNNFNPPVTQTAEAFIALNARTGRMLWANQRYGSDISPTPGTPQQDVDYDFGDSPKIYQVDGRTVVGAGQKSGIYWVLDATTGKLINGIQVEPGGLLGGLFADAAYHDGVVFANGIDWPGNGLFTGAPPVGGDLIAIAGDGSRELWRFSTPGSPDLSGVAVANGVVYFQSMTDGHLYALDERTGAELAKVLTGGSNSGPAIADGRIYLGTGPTFALLQTFEYPGAPGIVAVGLSR